jgi:hypothetical protein
MPKEIFSSLKVFILLGLSDLALLLAGLVLLPPPVEFELTKLFAAPGCLPQAVMNARVQTAKSTASVILFRIRHLQGCDVTNLTSRKDDGEV